MKTKLTLVHEQLVNNFLCYRLKNLWLTKKYFWKNKEIELFLNIVSRTGHFCNFFQKLGVSKILFEDSGFHKLGYSISIYNDSKPSTYFFNSKALLKIVQFL